MSEPSDAQPSQPQTPLHDAARAGDVAALRRMLDGGADANEEDWTGSPPLFYAVDGGSIGATRLLLEGGAEPNGGDTLTRPFVHAASKNRLDLMALLLQFGANPHLAEHGEGETALMSAAFHGNLEMVNFLLDLGVSPDVVARKAWTAVRYATERGHELIMARLKAAGAPESALEDESV